MQKQTIVEYHFEALFGGPLLASKSPTIDIEVLAEDVKTAVGHLLASESATVRDETRSYLDRGIAPQLAGPIFEILQHDGDSATRITANHLLSRSIDTAPNELSFNPARITFAVELAIASKSEAELSSALDLLVVSTGDTFAADILCDLAVSGSPCR